MSSILIVAIVIVLAGCTVGAAFYMSYKQKHPKIDRGDVCYLTLGEKDSGVLYQLRNPKGKIIYKAVFSKRISENEYEADFVNCVKHHSTPRRISSEVTRSVDNSYVSRPSFTYCGENIWDYLKARGLRIEKTTVYSDKTINWVYRGGEKIAIIEKAGGHHSPTTYRVRVFDDVYYLVFLSAFTIATLDK